MKANFNSPSKTQQKPEHPQEILYLTSFFSLAVQASFPGRLKFDTQEHLIWQIPVLSN